VLARKASAADAALQSSHPLGRCALALRREPSSRAGSPPAHHRRLNMLHPILSTAEDPVPHLSAERAAGFPALSLHSPFLTAHPDQLLSHARTRSVTHQLAQEPGTGVFVSEAFVRVPNAIRHEIKRWPERPSYGRIILSALESGHLSPRPFRLGQFPDPTLARCLLAAAFAFTDAMRVQPPALLALLFDGQPPTHQETFRRAIHEQAHWEGVTLPYRWSSGDLHSLIDALYEARFQSIAECLLNLVSILTPEGVRP
jgi:hypothetical protein